MRRKLTAVAVLAATAVTLAAVAAAGPVAAKQRVAIQLKGGASFVLTPLTSGAVKRDTGSASSCCWTRRYVTRDGLRHIEINDPQMTLTGKRGTLVAPQPDRVVRHPGRMDGHHRHLESRSWHRRLRRAFRRRTRSRRRAGQRQREDAVRRLSQPEIEPGIADDTGLPDGAARAPSGGLS